MTMSTIFSIVFYATSAREFDRRPGMVHFDDPDHEFDEWLGERSNAGKATLIQHLIILNIIILLGGTVMSYFLARMALRPIERVLDEQDRFISDASHELRTPITGTLLSNEVGLKNEALTIAEAKEILAETVADMKMLKALSDELLDQTRAIEIHEAPQMVNFKTFIREATSFVKGAASQKGIAIKRVVDNDDVSLSIHPLSKVVRILLDNAIKYSPNGSTIIVTAEIHTHGYTISVKDEGIGIHHSDQRHIFDRFYRSDASRSQYEGYGLGLSIAQAIISEMKGSIKVVSTPGIGSEFKIYVPRT